MEDKHRCDEPSAPQKPKWGWTDIKKGPEPSCMLPLENKYFKRGKTMRQAGGSQSVQLEGLVRPTA